ncbi:hypothetical protein FIBSPDRAFT_962005 [Athelia psychrophila]|uniref:Uncharacterized protein n=1 Tax=Athelia psychrophila TaxID=1759441 RepID=A0A166ALD5_9AGAM|nr:hypothetical protein FIBSPDRAFT_962005 [Fibularhizoctonia sp. CBS 109695]
MTIASPCDSTPWTRSRVCADDWEIINHRRYTQAISKKPSLGNIPDPQRKSDALLLTPNTEMHIAPKLRNSAFTASKAPTCDLQAITRALVCLCACRQGTSTDNSAYTRPELLALTPRATFESTSLTSFDARAFNGKAIREGDYLYRATLPLFSVPLDPSSNGFGRADMLHIDLMRHAETPVPTLKVFKHCWRKAVWHRPSVIAFDNVDKLLGMELEHPALQIHLPEMLLP